MSRWTCPKCDREFGLPNQSHFCSPGCTLEETFAGRPAYQRSAYDALVRHLETLGPLHVDAVRVGVFLKTERKLAEIRPMARSLSVELVLSRTVVHPRILRTIRISADGVVHVVRLTELAEVDSQLLDWLTEAYDDASL